MNPKQGSLAILHAGELYFVVQVLNSVNSWLLSSVILSIASLRKLIGIVFARFVKYIQGQALSERLLGNVFRIHFKYILTSVIASMQVFWSALQRNKLARIHSSHPIDLYFKLAIRL
jgi:hypothetical protein